VTYFIQQGAGLLATYFSARTGRDLGAATGWVRDLGAATRFASEDDALAALERMPHVAPMCRVVEEERPPVTPKAPPVDYYAVLELAPGASPREIKAAFRRLAMKHHPDRNAGDEEAVARFRAIRAAYEALREGSMAVRRNGL
jgi:DnaJ-domain-containing protein 1